MENEQENQTETNATEEQPISVLKFSKLLGCSHTTVQNAIKAGDIDKGVFRREGKPDKILPKIAIAEWREHVSINQIAQSPELAQNLLTGSEKPNKKSSGFSADAILEYEGREKYARARMAELNLEEREGTLVSMAEINKTMHAAGVEIRTMFETLGDRNIDAIRAAGSRNEGLIILDAAVNEILQRLSDLGFSGPGETE